MNKDRIILWKMFDGKCAYCGEKLGKRFHADHIDPKYRGGRDARENLYPACPRCNIRKATYTVEEFRKEISKQVEVLRNNSRPFRLAEDFNQIIPTNEPIVFWFEKY
jgi:5-methylcytosine-specific restriction endonuclease McrA